MRVELGSCNDSRTVVFLGTYVFTFACMNLFPTQETYLHQQKIIIRIIIIRLIQFLLLGLVLLDYSLVNIKIIIDTIDIVVASQEPVYYIIFIITIIIIMK